MTNNRTPIVPHHLHGVGDIFIKREDLFSVAGVYGGKARSCWSIVLKNKKRPVGLVTAGSRASPQVKIVAYIARHLHIPSRLHIPSGENTDVIEAVSKIPDATIIRHIPGYNTVLISRAKKDAEQSGFLYIPFGMECEGAVSQTANQFYDIPKEVTRIVVPVGSGMSLSGIMWGERIHWNTTHKNIPILGVCVGANPSKRLFHWGPAFNQNPPTLVRSPYPYSKRLDNVYLGDIPLDPIYEAKCMPFLKAGDLFWIVGNRNAHGGE